MTPATTLGAYGAALVLVFGGAYGAGQLAGPVDTTPATTHADTAAGAGSHADAGDHPGSADAPSTGDEPGGLSIARDGYALQLDENALTAGEPGVLAFQVLDADGRPVTEYVREHDKELHLVVARRDLAGFQHLHPVRDAAGRWSTPLTLAAPGSYQVIADFVPAGRETGLALGTDLTVPGTATVTPLPPARSTTTVDGYTVSLTGQLVAGRSSRLALRISRDGRPVTDLEPYLGAYGHLVALRAGDLAYLHVHPEQGPAGPEVVFSADVPAAGPHALFLDFSHDGVVRTAELTAQAVRPDDASTDADHEDADHEDAEHDAGSGGH